MRACWCRPIPGCAPRCARRTPSPKSRSRGEVSAGAGAGRHHGSGRARIRGRLPGALCAQWRPLLRCPGPRLAGQSPALRSAVENRCVDRAGPARARVDAAAGALQRLAHRPCARLSAFRGRRESAQRVHDSQHRLPGHFPARHARAARAARARFCDGRRRISRQALVSESGDPVRRCAYHREPDPCPRDSGRGTRLRAGRAAASARPGLDRDSQRVRYRAVESRDRCVSRAALRQRDARGKGRQQVGAAAAAASLRSTTKCRCSAW